MTSIGNPEKAKAASEQNAVNVAALLRENEYLRKVADAAVELRAAGRACDKIEEGMDDLNAVAALNGRTCCATPQLWARERFNTQMQKFDDAVAEAAAAGMGWAMAPQLGPRKLKLKE